MIDKILAACSIITLLCIMSYLGYHHYYQNNIKVVVELREGEDPFVAIPRIVPTDSRISEIREIDKINNEYEFTVTTTRKKVGLLDWLLKSHRVKTATIKN